MRSTKNEHCFLFQLVTSSGGWCKADSAPSSKQHLTDRPFAQDLAQFFTKRGYYMYIRFHIFIDIDVYLFLLSFFIVNVGA